MAVIAPRYLAEKSHSLRMRRARRMHLALAFFSQLSVASMHKLCKAPINVPTRRDVIYQIQELSPYYVSSSPLLVTFREVIESY
jgi:hypothetical protein